MYINMYICINVQSRSFLNLGLICYSMLQKYNENLH